MGELLWLLSNTCSLRKLTTVSLNFKTVEIADQDPRLGGKVVHMEMTPRVDSVPLASITLNRMWVLGSSDHRLLGVHLLPVVVYSRVLFSARSPMALVLSEQVRQWGCLLQTENESVPPPTCDLNLFLARMFPLQKSSWKINIVVTLPL